MNNHFFQEQTVRAVVNACSDAGVDVVEIGYKSDQKIFSRSEYGSWKYCTEDDISGLLDQLTRPVALAAMADAGRTDYRQDILPCSQSVLSMIRVAAYAHQIDEALHIIRDAQDKGYTTSLNLMAVSDLEDSDIHHALERTESLRPDPFIL